MSAQRKTRLLLALTAALSASACRDEHEANIAYTPGEPLYLGADPMPELPCVPREDARLHVLMPDCGGKDFEVVFGPIEGKDDAGHAVCRYHATYWTNPNEQCIVGRPLAGPTGEPRTAALVPNAAWSSFV